MNVHINFTYWLGLCNELIMLWQPVIGPLEQVTSEYVQAPMYSIETSIHFWFVIGQSDYINNCTMNLQTPEPSPPEGPPVC